MDHEQDPDPPQKAERPLPQIHGSHKNEEQAIDEEEEVMTDVVEKKKSKKEKKEMRKEKKEEEEKKEKGKKKIKEEEKEKKEDKKHFLCYNQLYKGIINNDWENAKRAFDIDPSAITGPITSFNSTALHLAVRTGVPIQFIKNLVGLMS